MVFHREVTRPVPMQSAYRFRPTGRLQSLQRWLWSKVKDHFFVPAVENLVSYQRIDFDSRDAMDKIFRASAELRRAGRDASQVLIGSSTFAELMARRDWHEAMLGGPGMDFNGELAYGWDDRGRPRQSVFGLKVRVVPHMEGILVL